MNAKQAGIEARWGMPWPWVVRELANECVKSQGSKDAWDAVAWMLNVSPRTLRRWRNTQEYRNFWRDRLMEKAS